jgi:hypothetical protein
MPLTDINGRPYARVQTVKAGDLVETDGDFTCMDEGKRQTVLADKNRHGFKRLYVECRCPGGRHYLCQQLGDDGELVGLYRCGPEGPTKTDAVPALALALRENRIVPQLDWPQRKR